MRAIVVLLIGATVACGSGARSKTISATLSAANSARDAFVIYDDERQAQIVRDATSLEEGRAELAAWRASRADVVAAFEVVYRAVAIAATSKDDQSIAEMIAALAAMREVYETVTGRSP